MPYEFARYADIHSACANQNQKLQAVEECDAILKLLRKWKEIVENNSRSRSVQLDNSS